MLPLERIRSLSQGRGLDFFGRDGALEGADLRVELFGLLVHLGFRALQSLLQLLQLLLRLLRVLDEEQVSLLQRREDVEKLLRPREVHRNFPRLPLVRVPRLILRILQLSFRRLLLLPLLVLHLLLLQHLWVWSLPLHALEGLHLCCEVFFCFLVLCCSQRLSLSFPLVAHLIFLQLMLLELIFDVLVRSQVVKELLVRLTFLQRLLVLGHLTLDRRDLSVELLDLLHLILLGFRLLLCFPYCLNRILIVLLQKTFKPRCILLQHCFALSQGLFSLLRLFFKLADFRALGVKGHLNEKHLPLLLDEICHVLLLSSPLLPEYLIGCFHAGASFPGLVEP
mmetsp:Transcript_6219/g.22057  ORF Transcript_6219/g.22057 Transcript_6219/m.22057 type:complete len:338 (+) Transcript_6219:1719-2732(+)